MTKHFTLKTEPKRLSLPQRINARYAWREEDLVLGILLIVGFFVAAFPSKWLELVNMLP